MPTRYLSADQRKQFGRFNGTFSQEDLAKHFTLDQKDLGVLLSLRGPRNRLGYATLLCSARFIGTFPESSGDVPAIASTYLQAQLDIEVEVSLSDYFLSKTFERHVRSIRERFGFIYFTDAPGVRFGLVRWLYAECWAGNEQPGALVLQAANWLIVRKVLLPGVSTLERLIGSVRERARLRLWKSLAGGLSDGQRAQIETLFDNGGTQLGEFEILRASPLKRRQSDFLHHLDRLDALRKFGLRLTPPKGVPSIQLERLSRVARRSKPSAIAALKEPRRTATVAALFYTLEASAQDDATELGEALISDLFREAEHAQATDRATHQRGLDKAALLLRNLAGMLISDGEMPFEAWQDTVYAHWPKDNIEEATRVAARADQNADLKFETAGDKRKIKVAKLDRLGEPDSLLTLRRHVHHLMPKAGIPDILLEVMSRTGFAKAFTHLSDRPAQAQGFETSLCAVLVAQACNIGFEPLARDDHPALRQSRLSWLNQNFIRPETLAAANAHIVSAHRKLPITANWGDGQTASADGMRFMAPKSAIHAGPNPKYFGRGRGITWYNMLSDQYSGLGAMVVPGTLRDSLGILSVLLEQETELDPAQIMTDNAAYSDSIFGLFWLLGYQFCPRLADIGGARLWRADKAANYGPLNTIAEGTINTKLIVENWEDLIRLAGSLKLGHLKAAGVMRILQVRERPTTLARALMHLGRLIKTMHILNYIDDADFRRRILVQLNRQEFRHKLARKIYHGDRGEMRNALRQGQEEQLGALGLALNAVTHWNAVYMQEAITQLTAQGCVIDPADVARLSPILWRHINFLGRYEITLPESVAQGRLRPLRNLTYEWDL